MGHVAGAPVEFNFSLIPGKPWHHLANAQVRYFQASSCVHAGTSYRAKCAGHYFRNDHLPNRNFDQLPFVFYAGSKPQKLKRTYKQSLKKRNLNPKP